MVTTSSLGSLTLFGALFLMAQTGGNLDLGEVVSGILLLLSGYLFSSSIRQGKEIAAIKRDVAHNEDAVAMLQGEASTVDRRITDSRHSLRQELTLDIGQLEDRMDRRLTELREGQLHIQRLIEKHFGGGTT